MKKALFLICLLLFSFGTSFAQIDSTLLKEFEEKLQKEGDEVELELKYWTCCFGGDDCNNNELIWSTLAKFLKAKDSIHIEIISHTDCRGDAAYNEALSNARSEVFLKVLKRKDISQKRITTAGYGGTKPKIACKCEACTDEEHEQNRRTAIRISKIDTI